MVIVSNILLYFLYTGNVRKKPDTAVGNYARMARSLPN
jgi:hypothetical protein